MDDQTIVTVGVDTHSDVHAAAESGQAGRLLAIASFPARPAAMPGSRPARKSFGVVDKVGIAGTGSLGASLLRFLADYGLAVVEVDRPGRSARRKNGKSGPLEAGSAASAVLSGRASGTPKTRDAQV